jgi:hippurate hydrolase
MTNKISVIITAIMLTTTALQAQNIKQVKLMADNDSLRLVGIFKDIHQNPELAFMEVRTSGIVAKQLKALGY